VHDDLAFLELRKRHDRTTESRCAVTCVEGIGLAYSLSDRKWKPRRYYGRSITSMTT
jgi:hypothetical protein